MLTGGSLRGGLSFGRQWVDWKDAWKDFETHFYVLKKKESLATCLPRGLADQIIHVQFGNVNVIIEYEN